VTPSLRASAAQSVNAQPGGLNMMHLRENKSQKDYYHPHVAEPEIIFGE
jgi:hypothetical protein